MKYKFENVYTSFEQNLDWLKRKQNLADCNIYEPYNQKAKELKLY